MVDYSVDWSFDSIQCAGTASSELLKQNGGFWYLYGQVGL